MDSTKLNKQWYTKWWIWLVVGLFFLGVLNKNKKTSNPSSSNNQIQNTNCIGNRDCINSVINNFYSTNKTILNESYEGDGRFKITALDPIRGVTFNAFVSTDCNCNITKVNISDVN